MPRHATKQDKAALLAIASIIAIGGLIYELILGTASSYLFGDSIVSFSLGIGFSLFGMGLGSLLAARYLKTPERHFMLNELILSLLGGSSVIILFSAFSFTRVYWLVFIVLSTAIGICIGLEIPLVVETYKKVYKRKDSSEFLTKILAVDYLGALIGSLLFPFILLPYLGLVRTALFVGLLNISVVVYMAWTRKHIISRVMRMLVTVVFVFLFSGFAYASRIERILTTATFNDPVVYFELSPFQRIVLTQHNDDTRLYLNNHLQFSSVDEKRYHETLAHAALTTAGRIDNVLILGGGDGLIAREVLAYGNAVSSITLVDLDPAVTHLAQHNRLITDINQSSLSDPKVNIINADAFSFVRDSKETYDVILIDLIDPANEKIAKLYSYDFYRYAQKRLSESGAIITQASSTYFTPRAFWSTNAAMHKAFNRTTPLSVNIPSFGEWGFIMSSAQSLQSSRDIPDNRSYITADILVAATQLQPETYEFKHNEYSTLLRPTIQRMYNQDLSRWSY